MTNALHIGIALDGAGWHPAAWREPDARAHDLFEVGYFADLARTAKRAGADLVTFEDAVGLQSSGFGPVDSRTDEVRGRLDALVLANAIAPVVGGIGLLPTITTTHIEPFHTATGIQTLDYTSEGWAGWRVQVSGRAHEAAHFGRRDLASFDLPTLRAGGPAADAQLRELFDEARDSVEVARRLWDSWEDDAIIRDVETGRFIDRDKLHYIDFVGDAFTVKGPSIVPRSPQGQPIVYVLAHQTVPYELAVAEADIVGITPRNDDELQGILSQLHTATEYVERRVDGALRVWAEAVILIEDTTAEATVALERLDAAHGTAYESDALLIVGSPADVAEQLKHWWERGLDGVRLRPARLPHDLDRFADHVAPLLAAEGLLERPPVAKSLRERLGDVRPRNRYT